MPTSEDRTQEATGIALSIGSAKMKVEKDNYKCLYWIAKNDEGAQRHMDDSGPTHEIDPFSTHMKRTIDEEFDGPICECDCLITWISPWTIDEEFDGPICESKIHREILEKFSRCFRYKIELQHDVSSSK